MHYAVTVLFILLCKISSMEDLITKHSFADQPVEGVTMDIIKECFRKFRQMTSTNEIKRAPCAVCAHGIALSKITKVPISTIPNSHHLLYLELEYEQGIFCLFFAFLILYYRYLYTSQWDVLG